jgi:DNA mismatch repair protein MutS
MAIARAVVEFVHNRKEVAARTLFATHYHELTSLADVLPRVRNAHVSVREEGGEVVFEHRIVPGPSDRSYGIHVAKLGLPGVINRAGTCCLSSRPARMACTAPPGNGPSASRRCSAASPVEEALARWTWTA